MTDEKNLNTRLLVGGAVTLIVGLITAVISFLYLFAEYEGLLKGFAKVGKNAGVVLQSMIQPIFAQILLVSGILLVVAAYGFFIKRNWAFIVGFVGSTLGIFGGWMLSMFPLMVGLPMKYMLVFVINAIAWFVLMAYVKRVGWKIMLSSFIFGIALTMNFMNGNAALNKMIGNELALASKFNEVAHVGMAKMMSGNPGLIFESIQKVLWFTAIGFGIACVAIIYRKDWVLPVAITASILSIVAGTPVAYLDTVVDKAGERLSMFAFAPILSVAMLILLLIFREKIWSEEKLKVKETVTQEVSA